MTPFFSVRDCLFGQDFLFACFSPRRQTAKLGRVDNRLNQRLKAIAVGLNRLHDPLHRLFVTQFDFSAAGVGKELLRQAMGKLAFAAEQNALQSCNASHFCSIRQFAEIIDRNLRRIGSCLVGSPLANGVVVL